MDVAGFEGRSNMTRSPFSRSLCALLATVGLAGAAAACTVAPIDATTSTSTTEPSTSTTSTTTSTTSTTTSTTIPWSPQLVTTETTVALTCGLASAMSNLVTADSARFRVEAPDGVLAGSSFDLVIRPYLVEVPTTFAGAGINKVNAMRTTYGLPAGATVDAVELEAMPGASTVGYYVAPGADRQDPAVRQAIPGGSSVLVDPVADTLTTVLGGTGTLTGSSGEFRKASAVQPPAVRVHLTSTAPAGTDLHLSLGGTVPADPRQMPWADPSTSRNLVTNLLIVPANVTQHCGPSAAAAPALSSTVVVELPN
jgi:hypothetical protein